MGKKKSSTQPSPIKVAKQIDYVKIVDGMNDVTFAFCVEFLYSVFDYQILQKEDIRRIDLKEELVRMQNAFLEDSKGRKQGFLNFYLSLIQMYFDDQLKCVEGSRADRSRRRALDAINMALEEGHDDNMLDIEDCILVFISLFREYLGMINSENNGSLINVDNGIMISDADILLRIYNDGIKAVGGPIKLPIPIVKGLLSPDDYAMKVLYVNSMVFLCVGLQARGEFIE